jgi:hypothetical protein
MNAGSRVGGLAALVVVCSSLLAVGCAAGGARYSSKAMAEVAAPPIALPPLEESVFSRDPWGQLTEEDLQRILASPIELDLPARVGILPVMTATDWRGPNPNYDTVPAGTAALLKELRGAEAFTLVTDVMPIPSGALGMEALREIAARYRLRYVLLYREVIGDKTTLNALAWGYTTLVGALFLPGQHLEVGGYLEASMFDVKTGLLMFTTRRAVSATKDTNVWYNDYKLSKLKRSLAVKFAPELAKDVRSDVARFTEAAELENERRVAKLMPEPAPSAAATPAPPTDPSTDTVPASTTVGP